MTDAITELEGYRAVAIDGKGVYLVGEDGNCWHVGGPDEDASEDNKLVRDYREAVNE